MRVACCLAQAALETAWGKRPIGFNLWGIKDLTWDPGSVTVGTHEVEAGKAVAQQAAFEDFDSYDHAFGCYGRLVTNSRYYQDAREALDLEGYVRCLARHWATDPLYSQKLLDIIADYELAQYDVGQEVPHAADPVVAPPPADPGFQF
jgi:flagellum-specific peptidoglycan hydrolase FlgJ